MPTPAITTAPTAPSFSRPALWDQEMMTFLEWMQALPPQLNALIPYLAAAAGPNGVAGVVRFSTTTTAADPGAGLLRLNNATQASATAAYIDLTDANGIDVTTLVARLGLGTSAIKGEFRLALAGDPTKFLSFELTSATSPTGYRALVLQNGVASVANPFADGDVLIWSYSRTGDKGDAGINVTWSSPLAAQTISGSPTTITFGPLPNSLANVNFDLNAVTLATMGQLYIAFSTDNGATFGTPVQITTGSGASAWTMLVEVIDYLASAGWVKAPGNSQSVYFRRSGGAVTHVRFSAGGTAFSSGVITPRLI